MITVSVPAWRTPPATVVEAIDAVLANTQVSLVVVTYDGGDQQPIEHDDPRVLTWRLGRNRGRYYVDDVVSRACRTPLFTVHDADDIADHGRLDAMAKTAADVVYTDRQTIHLDGRIAQRPAKRHPPATLDVIWGQMALYRTGWIRGLYHPGFRVSWDALIDNMAYRYGIARKANTSLLYTIRKRQGSLTTHRSSSLGSEYRRAVAAIHRRMWLQIESRCRSRDDVAAYLDASVDPKLKADRDGDVARLAAVMDRGRT